MLIKIRDNSVHIWAGLRAESQTNSGSVSNGSRMFANTPSLHTLSAPFAAPRSPDVGSSFPETQHIQGSLMLILGGVELHFPSFKPLQYVVLCYSQGRSLVVNTSRHNEPLCPTISS
jgi:hypothetical protein